MARGYFRMSHNIGKLPRWAVGTQGVLQKEEGGKLAHRGVMGVRDETEKPGMPPGGVRGQVPGQQLLRRTPVLNRDCQSVTSLPWLSL